MAKKEISRVVSVTDTGILLTTTTKQEIKYCTECPYHEQHGIVTPDSFEHDTGVYCSLVSADDDHNSHTYDGHVDELIDLPLLNIIAPEKTGAIVYLGEGQTASVCDGLLHGRRLEIINASISILLGSWCKRTTFASGH